MAFVPTSGPIRLTDIRNARNSDGSPGTTSTTFSVLRDNAVFSKFDLAYTGPVASLNDINKFSQFRNYPNNVVTLYQIDEIAFFGIANNENSINPLLSPGSPIQLICGYRAASGGGRIFRSTDYGLNYSFVLAIDDALFRIRFLPTFRHASFLTVAPFVAVGQGRIVTNSNIACTSFVTISSPTTQDLFDISFNSLGVGIIVGDRRILKTNTNNRINSWSIVNSNNNIWRSIASNGSTFVVVGDNSSIVTGNSLGTTWTPQSIPAPIGIAQLRGVTYHTDGYFYAVGFQSSNPFFVRSSNNGVSWEVFNTTGDPIIGALFSIESINGRLYVGGTNVQYEVEDGVARRFTADFTNSFTTRWRSIVKSDNSNGFHMAATVGVGEFFLDAFGGTSFF